MPFTGHFRAFLKLSLLLYFYIKLNPMRKYLFILLFVPFIGLAQPNATNCIDSSFGSGGTINISNAPVILQVMANDELLVVGGSDRYFHQPITKLTKNGVADTSFGTNGIAYINVPGYASGVEILFTVPQPDGSILAGITTTDTNAAANPYFLIIKLTVRGFLDTSFNMVLIKTQLVDSMNVLYAAVLQPDGKILIDGRLPGGSIELVRYNANGSIDRSFGTSGKVKVQPFSNANSLVILQQPNGKFLLSGELVSGAAAPLSFLMRLDTTGAIDSSFGTNGISFDSSNAFLYTVALTPSGIIGLSFQGLKSYNANGGLNSSFGANGSVSFPHDAGVGGLVVQQNGQIIVVYTKQMYYNYYGVNTIARYNIDGTPDVTFGTWGSIIYNTGYDPNHAYSDLNLVKLQSDGKVVTASSNYDDQSGWLYSTFLNRYFPTQHNWTTGVSNNKIKTGLYPNPTVDGIFELSVDGYHDAATISVTNMLGNVLWSDTRDLSTSSTTKINISKFPAGTYLIKVRTMDGGEYTTLGVKY